MRQIFTLAAKDIKVLTRDKSGFFFTFFFPLIIAILFGSIFGSGGGGTRTISILVVDEDSTEASAAFIKQLDDASEIDIELVSREVAVENVRKGNRVAFIALKRGFGEASEQMFWGDPPEVEVGVDPSRKAEAAMLQGILMKYGSKRFQEAFSNPAKMMSNLDFAKESLKTDTTIDESWRKNLGQLFGDLDRYFEAESTLIAAETDTAAVDSAMQENNVMQPLVVSMTEIMREKTGPTNSYAITFPQGIIWGIIGVAAAFGISIVFERTRGTMQRLRIAPVNLSHILAGKALACMTTIIAETIFLLLLAFLIFKVTTSSYLLLSMAVISSTLCFTGIMMLLSVLGKTERSVGGIGWAVMLIMSMLGGGMIPLMFMPAWMKSVASFSPVKWTIVSLEGALWRGFSFSEMLLPCGILIGVGVVSFIIGVVVIQKTEVN